MLAGWLNAHGAAAARGAAALEQLCEEQGFPRQRHWSDGDATFLKFTSDRFAGPWRQPPRFDPATGLAIVGDVRLVARPELIESLGDAAGPLDTTDDLALVCAAYRRWGTECPIHLLGDYAFAIWDAAAATLFAARDHIGARPLHYAMHEGRLCFASEIEMILALGEGSFPLDEDWLIAHLASKNVRSAQRTFYKGVQQLPPAHSLVCAAGEVTPRIERYWKPGTLPTQPPANDAAYADGLRAVVERAVADSLDMTMAGAADGHARGVGVHVSGGLDSSSIATMALRQLTARNQEKPKAYAWQPAPSTNTAQDPEHRWLAAMVEQLDLDLAYVPTTAEDSVANFQIDGTRVPMGGTFLLEQPVQRRAEHDGVGVMLSGWGGDEFASHNGRSYYPWLLSTGRWRTLADNMKLLHKFWPAAIPGNVIMPGLPDGWRRVWDRLRGRGAGRKGRVSLLLPPYQTSAPPRAAEITKNSSVRAMQLFLLELGHLTARLDSWGYHGRRHGLEYRYPLLDRRVIEFALSLPPHQLRRGKWKRFVFRNAMRGTVLPDAVVNNLSKDEPVRVTSTSQSSSEAERLLGAAIRNGDMVSQRLRYLDSEALIAMLLASEAGPQSPTPLGLELLAFRPPDRQSGGPR